jgi:hypothetical protein
MARNILYRQGLLRALLAPARLAELWQLCVHAMKNCIGEPKQTREQLKVDGQVELLTPYGTNYELSILKIVDLDQAGNQPKLKVVW